MVSLPTIGVALLLRQSRTNLEIEAELSKCISAAHNPLRLRTSDGLCDLQYAGYTLKTRLAILTEAYRPIQAGIWNLVQLPHHGEFLIPTYCEVVPKTFLGEVATDDRTISEHLVRYRVGGAGEHKLAVDAVLARGDQAISTLTINYLYWCSGTHSLTLPAIVLMSLPMRLPT